MLFLHAIVLSLARFFSLIPLRTKKTWDLFCENKYSVKPNITWEGEHIILSKTEMRRETT